MLNDAVPSELSPSSCLALFEAYPRLGQVVPWMQIGRWPTPVTEARHFAEQNGLKAMYVKREDLSHRDCAGNKVRGLEFILADAMRRGAKTLLTVGVVGSHHICRTAWHGGRFGLDTIAVVTDQHPADYVRRNVAAAVACGAAFVPANRATLMPKFAWQYVRTWLRQRRRPYCLPPGGTSRLACLGHVNAAFELKRQIAAGELAEPDYLYLALGSLGTAAGLLVGGKLTGLRTKLVGVVTAYRWYCTPGRWARMARRVHRLMQRMDRSVPALAFDQSEVSVIGTALGEAYAQPTAEGRRWGEAFRQAEGLELDGTYTAKTLHGAMQFIDRQQAHDRIHLFWQTYQSMPEVGPGEEPSAGALAGMGAMQGRLSAS